MKVEDSYLWDVVYMATQDRLNELCEEYPDLLDYFEKNLWLISSLSMGHVWEADKQKDIVITIHIRGEEKR